MLSLKLLVVFSTVFVIFYEAKNFDGEGFKLSVRIHGGIEINRNQWPWLASLVHVETDQFFCAGSIISEDRVLSAAHCVQPKGEYESLKPGEVIVHLGKHNLSVENEIGSDYFFPSMILVHPDWDITSERWDADLVLLIAETSIRFTKTIQPISLWSDPNESSESRGTVVGWGKSENVESHEDVPYQVEINRLRDVLCLTKFRFFSQVFSETERTFCAVGIKPESGPCTGDSGGGFYVQKNNGWEIQGIVSVGDKTKTHECDVSKPAIYTKVSRFRSWIQQKVEIVSLNVECNDNSISWHCIWESLKAPDRFKFVKAVLKSLSSDSIIRSLTIHDSNSRHFPSNIGGIFPNLEILKISYAKFEVNGRDKFANMKNLKEISIGDTPTLKSIPFDAYYDLPNLSKLNVYADSTSVFFNYKNAFIHNLNLVELGVSCPRCKIVERSFRNNRKLSDLSLKRFDMSGINRKYFENTDLRILRLQENNINSIPVDLFYDSPHIENISIVSNHFEFSHADTLIKNLDLKEFIIFLINLKSVEPGTFRMNQKLESLTLRNTQITKLSKSTFEGLTNLSFLDLRENKFETLPPDVFEHLPKTVKILRDSFAEARG